jgi:hypothetical protein
MNPFTGDGLWVTHAVGTVSPSLTCWLPAAEQPTSCARALC